MDDEHLMMQVSTIRDSILESEAICSIIKIVRLSDDMLWPYKDNRIKIEIAAEHHIIYICDILPRLFISSNFVYQSSYQGLYQSSDTLIAW